MEQKLKATTSTVALLFTFLIIGPMIRGITVYRNQFFHLFFGAVNLLSITGMILYLTIVAALVLPMAILSCLAIAPAGYTIGFVKDKKYIPLLLRMADQLEHVGIAIVNTRKAVNSFAHNIKRTVKWHWPLS